MTMVPIEFDLDMVEANLTSTQHSLRAVTTRLRNAEERGVPARKSDVDEFQTYSAIEAELVYARQRLLGVDDGLED